MVSTHIGFPAETVTVFVALSVGAIFIDLFMHRHDKPISLKSAALWSVFWVVVAMAFAGFLFVHHGAEVASLFVTGYALEKVLSVDNLFVMMAIFSWFSVPDRYRHRVLYWGIIGAIVFRGIFVAIGTGLLSLGPYVELIFAVVVAWTAVMMLKGGGDDVLLALARAERGRRQQGLIVRLAAAGRERDLTGVAAKVLCHRLARSLQGLRSLLPQRIQARRVAVALTQEGQHGIHGGLTHPRGGSIVSINVHVDSPLWCLRPGRSWNCKMPPEEFPIIPVG